MWASRYWGDYWSGHYWAIGDVYAQASAPMRASRRGGRTPYRAGLNYRTALWVPDPYGSDIDVLLPGDPDPVEEAPEPLPHGALHRLPPAPEPQRWIEPAEARFDLMGMLAEQARIEGEVRAAIQLRQQIMRNRAAAVLLLAV